MRSGRQPCCSDCPRKRTFPNVAASKPRIARTVVVLPMPLRPEQRRDLARFDGQIQAEQNLTLSVRSLQARHFQDSRHSVASSPRYARLTSASARISCGEPDAITRPDTSTEMRSARRNTASMSCSTSNKLTSLRRLGDQLDHSLRLVRPHPGHRLIQQQKLRLRRERQTHFELPLLAVCEAFQPRRRHARSVPRAPACRGRHRTRPTRRLTERQKRRLEPASRLHRHHHVVQYRAAFENAGHLIRTRQPRPDSAVHRHCGHVVSREAHSPFVRLQCAGDLVDQRGLASAVGSDQSVDLAAANRQIHAVRRGKTPETFDDACRVREALQPCGVRARIMLSRPLGANITTASNTTPTPSCQCIV